MNDTLPSSHQSIAVGQVSTQAPDSGIKRTETLMAVHEGPLPPASELALYNNCVRDGAERIFQMTEAQAAHRMAVDNKDLQARISLAFRGQVFGFVLGFVGLGGGLVAILTSHDWAGTTMAGASLVALVTAFLKHYSTKVDEKE